MKSKKLKLTPSLESHMLEQYKKSEEVAFSRAGSVLLDFKQELLRLGYSFEVLNQAESLLPTHKTDVLPVVIKYYKKATLKNEKQYLLKWFHHRGFDEVVPMLLEEYFSNYQDIDRWAIGDRLYQIRSPKYIDQYLSIIQNKTYGINRQMIVLLVGKLKVVSAIPILIELLSDSDVRLHALTALSDFKKAEFRPIFEGFVNDKNAALRKQAKSALKKLPIDSL